MEQKERKRGFRYMIGPLVLYWIVNLIVITLAESVFIMIYVGKQVVHMSSTQEVAQYMMDNIDKIYGMIASRTVELTTIGAIATLVLASFIFWRDRKKEKEQKGAEGQADAETSGTAAWKYGILVVFGVAVCICLNNLVNMAGLAFYSEAYQETSEAFYSAGFGMQILGLGIIVPISEEFIFRGVIFHRYRQMTSLASAMMYSSVLFALSHGNLVQFVYALILGLFLAYAYEKYGSVMAPICLHVVMNLTSLVVTKMDGFTWMFGNYPRLCAVTVGAAFVGACAFVYIQRMGENPNDEETNENKITPDMFR